MSAATVVAAPHPASFVWHREYWLWIAAAGIAFRVLWLAVGLTRLRRHRLSARPLADPPVPSKVWVSAGTCRTPCPARSLSDGCGLPSCCHRAYADPARPDLREAIACHELIHVRRRDWLFVLAEESIRGLFWFHPGGLVRTQPDSARAGAGGRFRKVVRLLTNRDRYLDALLAVASHQLYPADVAPAPLFLKKRQLAERVSAILKETRMSKSRVIASLATVCSAALIAARVAMFFFPLQSPAQAVAQFSPDEPGVTVDAGGTLQHRNGVFFVGDTGGTVTCWRQPSAPRARVTAGCARIERSSGAARFGIAQRARMALRCQRGCSAHRSDFDPLRSGGGGPSRDSRRRSAHRHREAIATADHGRAHQYYGARRNAGPGAARPPSNPGARERHVQR